jgi:two-component system, OmpR family, response regulator
MLVLTRRLNETLLLPAIRTSIRVVALRPALVRLGIVAPPEVKVLREEVFRRAVADPVSPAPRDSRPPRLALPPHLVRDGLNNVTVALALIRSQLAGAGPDRLGPLLDRMDEDLQALQQHVQEARSGGGPALSAGLPAGPCPAGPA